MAKSQLPSQEAIRQLLSYDHESGKLFWKERGPENFMAGKRSASHACKLWNSRYSGKEAMTAVGGDGYLKGTIWGKYFLAHRVIWKIVMGIDPDEIDHINGNKRDNRWENLRDVDRNENAKNIATPLTNTSGNIGIHKRGPSWFVGIRGNGKQLHVGSYPTLEEAKNARKAAEVAYGFHPNHGREASTK